MNKLKTPQGETEEKSKQKKRGVVSSFFISMLDGSFLSSDKSLKNIPFMVFMAVLGGLYIANNYYAEKIIRKMDLTSKELKDLQSEYISLNSELMYRSNQSEVAKQAETRIGLMESKEPPFKIFISEDKKTSDN